MKTYIKLVRQIASIILNLLDKDITENHDYNQPQNFKDTLQNT